MTDKQFASRMSLPLTDEEALALVREIQQAARTSQSATGTAEPVLYQYRVRPTWHKTSWSKWENCTAEEAAARRTTPPLPDLLYEVRELIVAPQPARQGMGDDAPRAFKCIAHNGVGGNDPQDCDWPVCGCDPYADKVIASLEESGHLTTPQSAVLQDSAVRDAWVSVDERLPEEDQNVLFTNGKWIGVAQYMRDEYLEDIERWQDEHREFIEHLGPSVTHWMPLPAAPK